MTFFVSRMAPKLVCPSEPTPFGHLPLSVIDMSMTVRHYVELILVFVKGKEPAKVIRDALAKALVPYYPVAGRIVADSDNNERLRVALTGEGVPFVEASADCTLHDVNYFQQQPLVIPQEQLLPSFPGDTDHSAAIFKLQPIPFMMQVTQFNCGGFTVGIKFNHTMFDGVGVGQFMVAMGEMARGLGELTIKPVWCRESIPGRKPELLSSVGADPSLPITKQPSDDTKFELCTIDLSLDYINQLNDRFTRETGERFTTFEIAVAKIWQCRTRAIALQPDVTVTLSFIVDNRPQLNDILPSEGTGYYGNCLYLGVIEAPSEQIANASLFDIAKLIKQEKESMPGKYKRMIEGLELPPAEALNYGTIVVSDWRRLGFSYTDCGWGMPNYIALVPENEGSYSWACLLNSPPPMKGIRLTMRAVPKEHSQVFLNGMNDYS